MPELPEVETIKNDLREKILDKKIIGFSIEKKSARNRVKDFSQKLVGNRFTDIDRIGKLLIFKIGKKDDFLLIHLKMTGQLIYVHEEEIVAGGHSLGKALELPNKYTRAVLEFAGQSKLFFNDLRRFGYLEIVDKNRLEKVKSRFGIEPLKPNFRFTDFKKVFQDKKAPVKAVLMDQSKIAGIGNIYADEILFESRIMPNRPAGSLGENELKKVFKACEDILKKAIKCRGTTFSDYCDTEGKKGNFTRFLKVYGRKEGEKCLNCPGIIKKMKIGGRSTKYCESCQK